MRHVFSLALFLSLPLAGFAAEPKNLKILFLGDAGHHRPAERYRDLAKGLESRRIELVYTDRADALSAKNLAGYDGLIVYANIDAITPEQEQALLGFVEGGKGFIPLHCASYCFRNSEQYVALVGAQFSRHGTGTFRVTPAVKDHPITKGFGGFESWDETYVHTKHNEKDRTVLEYREGPKEREPWTWVRTQGKGRVFYTAWGHDERTFGHPGFHNLVERGIRWACGDEPASVPTFFDRPEMVGPSKDVKPFEFVEAKLPFYPPNRGKGGPINRMQKPLPPEESMKHYQHPADLELKLFASEPSFGGKPIALNWDERGRLWVAVTVDYPNDLQREGQGNDRILICEDTTGDGMADRFTVFADKLSIPTSLTFAYGGVVVHQAPHTLFLKDTDGDDKADVRTVLFSGWGTGDTHAGPSNLRYGPDGWYYGMVGYSGFNGTVAGERFRFSQGFYRFLLEQDDKGEVRVTKFEFLRGTSNNSWGVGFSEEGHLFGSTANGCASVYLPIPNRYYEKVRGFSSTVLRSILPSNQIQPIVKDYRQVDFHGGFTAAAGHALYTARAYAREYWNRTAFVSEPTGHLTATLVLKPSGTDYSASYGWNLLAGQDDWSSPIVAEVGPDGNMWVIDWYNIIVQHNPTPAGFDNGRGNAYVTPLRDKKHGRVYRLVPKNHKPASVDLSKANDEQLVAALKNTNMLWRLHAQRLLVERKAVGAAGEIRKLLDDRTVDEVGLNAGALHAVWTLHGLGLLAGNLGVDHPSPAVRAAAIRFLPIAAENPGVPIRDLLADPNMHVRLNTLLRLSELAPSTEIGEAIARMLDDSTNLADRWLPDAITIAGATHAPGFLPGVLTRKLSTRGTEIVSVVAEHVGRSGTEGIAEVLQRSAEKADPATAEVVIAGLARGWPKGKTVTLTEDTEKGLVSLLQKLPSSGRGQLIRLASVWGSRAFDKYTAEITSALEAKLRDAKASDTERAAAARQFIEFRIADADAIDLILQSITLRMSPALASGMLEAAALSNSPALGAKIIERYGEWSPALRNAALRVLLAKPDATRTFLQAVEAGKISIDDLVLDQKQALASHPDAAIQKRARGILTRGGGLPNADRQKVIEELKPILARTGDAVAGKAMFTKHCAACHQHSGEGTNIGPDLTGMAVHPKEELLTHIIDPSRSVEGNFKLYQVTLVTEQVLNGMLASETRTTIELIDAQAKRHVLLREDIEALRPSNKSLMPDGFEKQMTEEEMTNLLEFLTKRGRFLPLPLDKAATIVTTKGMFYSETATGERLVLSDWKPRTVEGVPFTLIDPQGDKVKNAILLNGPLGDVSRKMPRTARVGVNGPAKLIHLLSGVSGWGAPFSREKTVSLIVRLHYADGQTEDHELRNAEHFADYINRSDVPGSKFAFGFQGRQQMRYLNLAPRRDASIKEIEFVKGPDQTAPIVFAVTVEGK